METKTEKKQSILARLLEGAAEAIKRPLVEKRIVRAFSTAEDSLEEQTLDNEAKLDSTRESLVKAAKNGENIKSYIETLIALQQEKTNLEGGKKALAAEKEAFLN